MICEDHTNYISKKISSGLYALNSLKFQMPSHVLRALYFTMIHPHLSYACVLWGNTFQEYIKKIGILQKKAIHIICSAKYNASTTTLFKEKGILKVDDLYKLNICQLMHKQYMQKSPIPLIGLFTQHLEVHDHLTRHRRDFMPMYFRNKTVQCSFLHEGPRFWNLLPEHCKALNYRRFSCCLKMMYIESY